MTIYLDCNATTPIEPEVLEIAIHYMRDEFGNAGSRTHQFGVRAKRAVDVARKQVADVVEARPEEVIFTSGATESNNLALLGVARAHKNDGRLHIITSPIEHKAVLEPLEQLAKEGFEIEYLPMDERGWVDPEDLARALRPDTLMVSLMHVNNETGVVQPIDQYAEVLHDHGAFLHVDAAQGFGKELNTLRSHRLDLISISGHKLYAPKGIGALIARRRGRSAISIEPLMFGGGQERSLRPGTHAVHAIAALGKAAETALSTQASRALTQRAALERGLRAIEHADLVVNGDTSRLLGNCLSLSFNGVDSEALMLRLKGTAAVSNGSACTSSSYEPSHVLVGMGLTAARCEATVRISWSHLTGAPDWETIIQCAQSLQPLETTYE